MSTLEKQEFVKENIDTVDDKFLDTVYELFLSHLGLRTNSFELTDDQKQELDRRTALYHSGKAKTYTWEEVKQNLGI